MAQYSIYGTLTLIVEAVDAVDGGTLVVSPQQEEVLRVFDLVGQQETDGLQRLLPSVHIVTQEQVVALRRVSSVLEESEQVVVLPVDIACGEESVSFAECWLFQQHDRLNQLWKTFDSSRN